MKTTGTKKAELSKSATLEESRLLPKEEVSLTPLASTPYVSEPLMEKAEESDDKTVTNQLKIIFK